MYKWFARISIVLLPVLFLILYPAWSLSLGKQYSFFNEFEFQNYNNQKKISDKYLEALDALGLITNVISCTIFAMFLRLIHKFAMSMTVGVESIDE